MGGMGLGPASLCPGQAQVAAEGVHRNWCRSDHSIRRNSGNRHRADNRLSLTALLSEAVPRIPGRSFIVRLGNETEGRGRVHRGDGEGADPPHLETGGVSKGSKA